MADEQLNLEALEAAAQAELDAEEASSNATEDELNDKGQEGKAGVETQGAGTEQAALVEGKSKTVQIPIAKLQKEREKRRHEAEERERLQRQNEELQRQLSLVGNKGQAATTASPPTLEQFDFDESAYQKAMVDFFSGSIDQRLSAAQQKQLEQQQQQAFAQRIESDVNSHYERVSKLGFGDDYIPAEQATRDRFGDFAVEQMISAIGEGSEKVIYHIGLNPDAMDEVSKLLQHDHTGFRAMAYLGNLAAKLNAQPSQKKISQAPAADRALTGGTGVAGSSAVLKKLERLNGQPNRDKFREYKKELIAAGQSELLRSNGYI